MRFPFFASFVLFIFILHHNMNKGKKSSQQQEAEYWKNEIDANHVRKQSLEDLSYISFHAEPFYPLTLLGADICSDFLISYPEAKEILSRFLFLENQKIVNLGALDYCLDYQPRALPVVPSAHGVPGMGGQTTPASDLITWSEVSGFGAHLQVW